MIELPEAAVLASQLNEKVKGNKIKRVVAALSPHKFVWYHGNPQNYNSLLKAKIFNSAVNVGGIVEITADNTVLALSDGVGLRYHPDDKKLPHKHQLLIEFDNSTFLTASVQLYGGIMCFNKGECKNKYYLTAKEKPSPISQKFNKEYFLELISAPGIQNKSVKFLLATEQRIPGLGNGVLQDILFNAEINPKRKIETLTGTGKTWLFQSIKDVLSDMIRKGGRDTEKDLFGNNGGYITKLSKNTAGRPCIKCGSLIKKENYMGGSIYYCPQCQRWPD